MDLSPEILCWNPRGLNDSAKRDAVRVVVDSLRVNLVCFQETKMAVIDNFTVNQCLGPDFDGYDYLPANETRGGILIAWKCAAMMVTNIVRDSFAISGAGSLARWQHMVVICGLWTSEQRREGPVRG
jgi:exonuclease III